MEIAARVEAIAGEGADTKDQVREKINFLACSKDSGISGMEYEIKLQPDAKPFSLHTKRHTPATLRESQTRASQNGGDGGIIEPTEWCAGMVAIPKKSGAIRICVDLKPLNSSVLRETHPLDEILAQLRIRGHLTGCKLRIYRQLNPTGRRVTTVDNLHHPLRQILFQQTPLWNLECPGALPNKVLCVKWTMFSSLARTSENLTNDWKQC
jgi:hypothetical protein